MHRIAPCRVYVTSEQCIKNAYCLRDGKKPSSTVDFLISATSMNLH